MAKKRVIKKKASAARTKVRSARKSSAAAKAKTARPRPARRASAPPRRAAAAPNPLRVLAQRIVELTIRGDDEGTFPLYADTVESVEMGMPPAVGIDAIRQKFTMWRGMVSDSTWQARNVWVDGNTIMIEWAGQVTFAATGRRAELNEIAVHEIANGKIVRERFYYDRSVLQP
jgi:ketosteroid isomerase-like protein